MGNSIWWEAILGMLYIVPSCWPRYWALVGRMLPAKHCHSGIQWIIFNFVALLFWMCDCILQTQHRLLHASYGVEHATHHIVVCGGHVCTLARSRSQQNFTRLACLSDSIWSRVLLSYMLDFTFGEILIFFITTFPIFAGKQIPSFDLLRCPVV